MKSFVAGLLVAALALPCSALAQAEEDFDPATVDLVKLIECQTYDVPSYNALAFWLAGTEGADARRHLGFTEVKSANYLLKEYRLAKPVTVFGRQTSRVAFTNSGPMAVLDDADPRPLAKALNVEAVIDAPTKFMGERVISQTSEKIGANTIGMRVSLNVSTVSSHPGKTLAGCSYRLDVE